MKQCKFYILCALVAISVSAFAQNTDKNNTVTAIKVKELNLKKVNLQKQINIEDRKRNQLINGVTAETQEILNDKQDSICLELRSQLVSVELELKELVPNEMAAAVTGRLNAMTQNQQQATQTSNAGKPAEAKKD